MSHFCDIRKLFDALNGLDINGNSLIVIVHNLEIIRCADWVLDLRPDGGNNGGYLIFEGRAEEVVKCKESITGTYLYEQLS